ncbi:restriction endonuclease subunit S [Trichormus sp. NMC-1]|uniref:restriction endonuclease subunit S n=1 Tax=Trichormus sp. NMC-1 TaxID=1853259 RepID=UPI0008DC0564|nr:restriction endonuclease subunit S [Trichormus sp. NMC-1]
MSEVYPLVTLGNVINYRKEFVQIDDTKTYKRCRVKLHAQGIILRDILKGAEIKTKKQQVCRKGEFLVAEIDAKIGGIGIVPENLDGAIVSSHYFLFEINESLINKQFLNFFIRTPIFRDQIAAQGSTNYAAIRPSDVLSYSIPLPPLEEQRRIVARIEELVGKIEEVRSLRQQALEETEALRVSSAKAILAEIAPLGTQPLQELVNVQGGGTPSKQNPFFWEGSIPWISPKDMKSREINDSIDHISEEATHKSPAKLLQPSSVLIVVRGMILAHTVPSAILRVPAAINQDMKALLPNEKITPEFLCSVFWTLNDLLLELVEKSTHDTRKLETPKLLNFKIPVPPLPEQRRIVAYLDELQTKIDTMKKLREEAIKELDAILPSILDKAFKGEL